MRHIENQSIYWYCSHCRQKLPDALVQGNQMTSRQSGSKQHQIARRRKTMLLCQYSNPTVRPQVLRITNGTNHHVERVALPKQDIVFQAEPEAVLEVISGQPITAMIEACIPCKSLCVKVIKSVGQRAAVSSLPMMDLSSNENLPGDRGEAASPSERV